MEVSEKALHRCCNQSMSLPFRDWSSGPSTGVSSAGVALDHGVFRYPVLQRLVDRASGYAPTRQVMQQRPLTRDLNEYSQEVALLSPSWTESCALCDSQEWQLLCQSATRKRSTTT